MLTSTKNAVEAIRKGLNRGAGHTNTATTAQEYSDAEKLVILAVGTTLVSYILRNTSGKPVSTGFL